MNRYTIKYFPKNIDWDSVPALDVSNVLWLPDCNIRMSQQICYDDNAIYIHQKSVEKNIRAELSTPLAMVCDDSCMEFFFCPDPDSDRYFNFEWNLNSCLYLGFCANRENSVRLILPNHSELFDAHTALTDDGWELFYKIPLSFIRLFFPDFKLESGALLRANCYKCGDKTPHPHYLSWNPSTSETPDFHRPCDFGTMIFE